jgi:flagellar hook-length control protein FliK
VKKVEIGGLGFFNTLATSVKESSQSSSGNAFQGLFGLLTAETPQNIESMKMDTQLSGISEKELQELIQLLNKEDILDIENGLELLNDSLSLNGQEELLVLIEEKISTGVKIEDLIQQIQLDLNLPLESIMDYGTKVTELEEGESPELIVEELAIIFNQILSMSMKDLNEFLNGKGTDFLKTVKLFDLLNESGSNFADKSILKDLILQLSKKLESLAENGSKDTIISSDKQASRQEYLNKSFTALASELKVTGNKEGQSEQRPTAIRLDNSNGLIQFQQMSKAEQLTLTLSQSGKPTSASDLIKQFENILAKSQFSNIAGSQKLLIKLNPEHLGALRIELIQRDAGIVAKIMTTTQVAKETLESHLNGLKQAFGSQNIQVDRVEVSQAMTQQQERFLSRDQGQQSHQQEQSSKEQEHSENDSVDGSFNESLEEAIVNAEA